MPRQSKLAEEATKQAWAAAHPESTPITKAKQKQPKRFKPFSRTDTYAALGLLAGVLLVIIVPPLWLKAVLLAGESVGIFLFLKYAHWSHGWSRFKRNSIASAIVVILLAVGIPQFISQWKAEHEEVSSSLSHQDPVAVEIEKGGKWISTDDIVYGPDGRAIENHGEIDSKGLQVNPTNPASPPVTHDRVVLNQLFKFIEEGVDLRQESDFKSWNTKVGQYISNNVDTSLAAKFVEAPGMGAKRRVLGECIQLVTQKIHAR
jgi:hypothetical protein